MAEINDRLAGDEELRGLLQSSIDGYVQRRDALFPLGRSGHPGGGPDRVKCLHAHTAHHLITGDNPIGRWVLEELDWREPNDPCV